MELADFSTAFLTTGYKLLVPATAERLTLLSFTHPFTPLAWLLIFGLVTERVKALAGTFFQVSVDTKSARTSFAHSSDWRCVARSH